MDLDMKIEPEEPYISTTESVKRARLRYLDKMEEEDRFLVQLVQQFPFLYDKDLKEFKDLGMKLNAWKSIGEMMNISHDAAASRWKAIRERFAREKKQQSVLADGTIPPPSNWRLYNAMAFLEKHVKPRKIRSIPAISKLEMPKAVVTTPVLSAEEPPTWHTVTQLMEPTMEETPSTFLLVQSPVPVRTPSPDSQSTSSHSVSPPKKKPRKTLEHSLIEAVDIVKTTSQHLLSKTNEKTEDNLFAQSIAKSIVDLLSRCKRKQKHRKKIAILQMINDLDTDDDI